jgi:zinc and cadmium transporter
VAILHLLPHAWLQLNSVDRAVWWLLGGFLVMFFIQRFFQFHHHDVPEDAHETGGTAHTDHGAHRHDHSLAHQSASQLSWGGAALGLSLHTLIDGIALAASVTAESSHPEANWLFGLGTFLVIILHKPFDAMAIGTLMAAGGWSRGSRHIVNVSFALAIPLGVAAFYFGAAQFTGTAGQFVGSALAFTAGTFLCIAASDLLPELQFHSHDRVKLSLALIAGLAFAALLGKIEGEGHGHDHGHEHESQAEEAVVPGHNH